MNPFFKLVKYGDILHQLNLVNPTIVQLFSLIEGVESLPVILAQYAFGDMPLKSGKFYIKTPEACVEYKGVVSQKLKRLLNYQWGSIPFGLVLNGSSESHINSNTGVVPFMLQTPGKTFGLLSLFDDSNPTNMIRTIYSTSAGCRSLILLPKISYELANKRLQVKYNLDCNLLSPKKMSAQWPLFKGIINSEEFKTGWNTKFVFFTRPFVEAITSNSEVRYKLLDSVWQATSLRRHTMAHNFLWSTFISGLPLSLRNDVFAIQTLQHVILLALGAVPGYLPAIDDISAPILELTDVFIQTYKIKTNQPIFMRLGLYDRKAPIYYSIQMKSFFYNLPTEKESRFKLEELLKLQRLLKMFKSFVVKGGAGFPLDETSIYHTLEHNDFDFFHPKGERSIHSNMGLILKDDCRFKNKHLLSRMSPNLEFPKNALFLHGCIRIMPSKEKRRA